MKSPNRLNSSMFSDQLILGSAEDALATDVPAGHAESRYKYTLTKEQV